MAKTIEELRAEYPELTQQLEAEAKAAAPAADQSVVDKAVEAERIRQKEIDDIAAAVNDSDLVAEAKYGEKPCTAQELAFRAMQKQAKQGDQYIVNTQKDYEDSKAAEVEASPNGADKDAAKDVEEVVDTGVQAAKKAFSGGR